MDRNRHPVMTHTSTYHSLRWRIKIIVGKTRALRGYCATCYGRRAHSKGHYNLHLQVGAGEGDSSLYGAVNFVNCPSRPRRCLLIAEGSE
jgi:hypothetical protein